MSRPDEPLKTKREPFIKIFHAGGLDNTFRPVTDDDKRKYPDLWDAFEKGMAQDEIGWPIEKVPFLDDAQAYGYREIGIKTLEALADAHDVTVQKIMGGREHREKARAMLKDTAEKKPLMDALSELEAQKKELAEMRAQLSQMRQAQPETPQPVMGSDVVPMGGNITITRPEKSEPGRQSQLSKRLPPAVLPESDN